MMESIGTYLKKQREMRRISLDEISRATKINLRNLEALEENDFSSLPGPVFAKSFVKLYAKSIGLDGDEAMLHCEHYLKSVLNHDPDRKQRVRWLRPAKEKLKPWAVFVLFVAVLALTAFFTSR